MRCYHHIVNLSELLHAYDQKGTVVKTQERKSLLKEIEDYSRQHGDANVAVPAIYVILTNSEGKLYIVKRGDKPENPNRYCKSVGGHVTAGESHISSLYRETKEEIGADVVLTDIVGFHNAVREIDTTRYAVVRPIDFNPWMKSVRAVRAGEPWVKRYRVMIFAGVFDGPVEFDDGEATGLQLFSKEKLLQEMKATPNKFTYDLEVLLQNYSSFF